MEDYVNSAWAPVLAHNSLGGFDDWWGLQAPWFEEPNERRGGWSGVSRVALPTPDGGAAVIFLKRQENHVFRTFLHPLSGQPTILREMENIQRFTAAGVSVVVPVYFAMRKVAGKQRAILATEALVGFISLEELFHHWQKVGEPPRRFRARLLSTIAATLRPMHQAHLQHNCLYPKHLLLRLRDRSGGYFRVDGPPLDVDGAVEVRLIDLEKARRRRLFPKRAAPHDLSTLNRRAPGWRASDRLRFLLDYLEEESVTPAVRRFWEELRRKAAHKFAQGGRRP